MPLSAKHVIERLSDQHKVRASVVYRALRRLLDENRILRVETLASYTILPLAPALLLVCSSCGMVHSVPAGALHRAIGRRADERGFRVSRIVAEAAALCPDCRGAPGQDG